MLAMPSRSPGFLRRDAFRRGDLVVQCFLSGREEDDGECREVFQRVEQGAGGRPGGLV
jgi:hypothetical protein